MTDTRQFHKDLWHLLTDLSIALDTEDADFIRRTYAAVLAQHLDELQGVIDAEREPASPPAAFIDPMQVEIWEGETWRKG